MSFDDLCYFSPCLGVLVLIVYMGIELCGLIPMLGIVVFAIAATLALSKYL